MNCDARSIPLNRFEEALLADLLDAQSLRARSMAAPTTPVQRHHVKRSLVLVAAAVVAVVVGGTAVGLVDVNSKTASASQVLPEPLAVRHGSHAAAVRFLDRVATIQSRTAAGSGPVQYAETQNYALETTVGGHTSSTAVQTTVRRVWRSPSGRTVVHEYEQDTTRYGANLGGLKPLSVINHSGTYGPGGWADPNASLPTTTRGYFDAIRWEVARSIAQDHPVDSATYDFTVGDQVDTSLGTGTASPQQTAGAYELLATASGTFYAGRVTIGGPAGRSGVAIGLMVSDPRTTIVTGTDYFVINAVTGAFLGVEEIDTPYAPPALHLPPGPTVAQYNLVEAARRVDAVGTTSTR